MQHETQFFDADLPKRLTSFICEYDDDVSQQLHSYVGAFLLSPRFRIGVYEQESGHQYLVVEGPHEAEAMEMLVSNSDKIDRTMSFTVGDRTHCYYR